MATRGRITAALSTVLSSEAFSGVYGDVAKGFKTADWTVSASYDSHDFLLCTYTWHFFPKDLTFGAFGAAHRAPLNIGKSGLREQVSAPGSNANGKKLLSPGCKGSRLEQVSDHIVAERLNLPRATIQSFPTHVYQFIFNLASISEWKSAPSLVSSAL